MLFWTHIYDLIIKLITILICMILMLDYFPLLQDNKTISIIIAVGLYFLSYHFIVRTLATFLYCKFSLGMPISIQQAQNFNNIFTPTLSTELTWMPMTEIKLLPKSERYQTALKINLEWKAQKTQTKIQNQQDFKDASIKTKSLTIIMYIVMVYFALSAFLNIFPANKITDFFCSIFQTESYFPALNIIILLLPTFWIFKLIDKNIK